jgi:cytochrome P450
MEWEWILAFSKYTESFRQARKLLDRSLRPASIATYRPLLQTKAHVLLTHALANPVELDAHFHQFVALPSFRAVSLNNITTIQSVRFANLSYGVWLRSQGDQ